MAFPGEHYQHLLANLASEIYHNRYPVEHGVDILHGAMRDGVPDALKVRGLGAACILSRVEPGALVHSKTREITRDKEEKKCGDFYFLSKEARVRAPLLCVCAHVHLFRTDSLV